MDDNMVLDNDESDNSKIGKEERSESPPNTNFGEERCEHQPDTSTYSEFIEKEKDNIANNRYNL